MRKRRLALSSAYLKKLFLSFALVLVPAFAIFTLCTESLFANQERALVEAMRTELSQLENQLQLQAQAFELQSLYLGVRSEYTPAKVLQNKYDATRAIRSLEDIKAYNGMVWEVILNYDYENIYTSAGMSRISTFLGSQLRLVYDSRERFTEVVVGRGEKSIWLLRASDTHGYLLYHYPVGMGRVSGNNASLNFLVDLQAQGQSLHALTFGYDRLVLMQLPDQQTVVYGELANAAGYGVRIMDEAEALRLAGNGYILIDSGGTSGALRLTTALRAGLLYAPVNRLRVTTFSLLAGLLFFAMGIALLLSMRNAKPIRQLARRATGNGGDTAHRTDEIDAIRRMIDTAADENKRMSLQVQEARATVGRQTMLLLLNGVIRDPEVATGMLAVGGLELHERCFAVALVYPLDAADSGDRPWLELASTLPALALCCMPSIAGRRVIAALIDLPNDDLDQARRLAIADALEAACAEEGLTAPGICYSRVYEELSDIHQAFIEASFVYRAGTHGQDACVFYEDFVADARPAAGFPAERAQRLENALLALDRRRIEDCLEDLQRIIAREPSAQTRVSLRYQILQLLLRTLAEQGREQAYFTDISHIDPSDAERFGAQVHAIVGRLCAGQSAEPDGAYRDILAFLQAHYTDQNLTLDDVAAHVGLSKTHISRLFRAKGNIKYIDYLTRLRMEEALRLLRQTDLPIREVTLRVGYWDVVSFQKKFKTLYGINPSEYRRKQDEPVSE